jgi:hypothetical protein
MKTVRWKGRDFADSGMNIQDSLVHALKSIPRETNFAILWNGLPTRNAWWERVPKVGRMRMQFVSPSTTPNQGVRTDVRGRGTHLPAVGWQKRLLTWHDPRFEDSVEYDYETEDGLMVVWNVFAPATNSLASEYWTGNAGMQREVLGRGRFRYSCSPGWANPPDFTSLVVELSVTPRLRGELLTARTT